MNVELFLADGDEVEVGWDSAIPTTFLWLTHRRDRTRTGTFTWELDDYARDKLRELVRQWDRDDEAVNRASEINPCPFYAVKTLDGYLPCKLVNHHRGPHMPASDSETIPFSRANPWPGVDVNQPPSPICDTCGEAVKPSPCGSSFHWAHTDSGLFGHYGVNKDGFATVDGTMRVPPELAPSDPVAS